MPRDLGGAPSAPLAERVAALNARYRHHAAADVIGAALADPHIGEIALVSSFGADSVVLLHLISVKAPAIPVVFLDTHMLFQDTIDYQLALTERLGLTVRRIRPAPAALLAEDPDGTLHRAAPDACCDLRKTRPLEAALAPFDAWITGRKRHQTSARAGLEIFEAEGDKRIKINPLAHWRPEDVAAYIDNNALPRHPLVARGYPSIGCAPCTSRVAPGEDPRAGRWRGQGKDECGIHFVNGNLVRA